MYRTKKLYFKLLGTYALYLHTDLSHRDRWIWLKKHLPKTLESKTFLEAGCGSSGAFPISASMLGYKAIGLSFAQEDIDKARDNAVLCHSDAKFELQDIRHLDQRDDLISKFDYVVCTETIEHIIDDSKLFTDLVKCIKPGGRLLMTAPNYYWRPFFFESFVYHPEPDEEDGGHVRWGYTKGMFQELCRKENIIVEEISGMSFLLNQLYSLILSKFGHALGRVAGVLLFPLKLFFTLIKPLFDPFANELTAESITLHGLKPK